MTDLNSSSSRWIQAKMETVRGRLPDFNVGDAIQVTYTPEVSIDKAQPIRGTVIAKKNKGIDSSFSIINYAEEDMFVAAYPYSSPLLKSIRVMQKNRITDGKKRSHRAKLYYLEDEPPKYYSVDASTMEAADREALKTAQKAARKQGKTLSPEQFFELQQKEQLKTERKEAAAAREEAAAQQRVERRAQLDAAAAAGEKLGVDVQKPKKVKKKRSKTPTKEDSSETVE